MSGYLGKHTVSKNFCFEANSKAQDANAVCQKSAAKTSRGLITGPSLRDGQAATRGR